MRLQEAGIVSYGGYVLSSGLWLNTPLGRSSYLGVLNSGVTPEPLQKSGKGSIKENRKLRDLLGSPR